MGAVEGASTPSSRKSARGASSGVVAGSSDAARRLEEAASSGSSDETHSITSNSSYSGSSSPASKGSTTSGSSDNSSSASEAEVPALARGRGKGKNSVKPPPPRQASQLTVAAAAAVIALTFLGVVRIGLLNEAEDDSGSGEAAAALSTSAKAERVAWFGWITAFSTGLGVLPFVAFRSIKPWWLGFCNAVAGGMMLAASACLAWEGLTHEAHESGSGGEGDHLSLTDALTSPLVFLQTAASAVSAAAALRVALGAAVGAFFILGSQAVLERHEHLKVAGFEGAGARRVLLILGVMTLHSLSEGVGLGVSFGSSHASFGTFITATLAIHNVPEGLAICLVLVPRGVPLLEAALWAVFTSLPQPAMAVPAFLSVRLFSALLPAGLGFAGGAMTWVALFELLEEAAEEIGAKKARLVAAGAAAAMWGLQALLKG